MNQPRWVFLRAYLLVALLVLCTGVALEWLLESPDSKLAEISETQLIQGSFVLAESYLPPGEEPATQQQFQQLQQRLENALTLPSTLHALSDFALLGEPLQQLAGGEIITLYDEADHTIFYKRLAQTEQVLALGPLTKTENERARWIVPVFYSLIALAVFLWMRPLGRDLEVLQDSAAALGQQDFSTRVLIPARSWLQPLGQTFNAMAQRIQWLLQSHRELTQAVSHELRTPLARMRFSLEMLETTKDEQRQRHFDSLARDIEELNSLIDEMLNYAELDQDNLVAKLDKVDMAEWLGDYIEEYGARDIAHELVLHNVPAGQTVLVDSRLLKRALDNLIGNAMRYARTVVSVGCELSDGQCKLWVRDDGPGIAPEKRAAVLVAYSRLEPDQRGVGHGFGLGLAIVKRVMELHGGDVHIDTAPSGGAEISLCWPS